MYRIPRRRTERSDMKAISEDISHSYHGSFLYIYSFAIYIDHIYCQSSQWPLSSPRECDWYARSGGSLPIFIRHTTPFPTRYRCWWLHVRNYSSDNSLQFILGTAKWKRTIDKVNQIYTLRQSLPDQASGAVSSAYYPIALIPIGTSVLYAKVLIINRK